MIFFPGWLKQKRISVSIKRQEVGGSVGEFPTVMSAITSKRGSGLPLSDPVPEVQLEVSSFEDKQIINE